MEKTFKNYLVLFWTFFKISLFTFGGGYTMVSLIQEELASKKKWVSDEELGNIIVIAESTPGPISLNCATFIGYKLLGVLGSIVATVAIMLPPTIIILIISVFYNEFRSLEIIDKAFKGISVGVAVLIILAALRLIKKTNKSVLKFILFPIATALVILNEFLGWNISTIYFILCGAVAGIITTAVIAAAKKNKTDKEGEK